MMTGHDIAGERHRNEQPIEQDVRCMGKLAL